MHKHSKPSSHNLESMMTNTTLLMMHNWDCSDFPSIDKEEEVRRYFHRGDAILHELRANYVDIIEEECDAMSISSSNCSFPTVSMSASDNSTATPAALPFPEITPLCIPARRRRGSRSRLHHSTAAEQGASCFDKTLADLVEYLDDLRFDGARNPFEEDSTPQDISKDTEQFLLANTSSNLTPLVIKPIALRAIDMVKRRANF